MTAVEVLHTLQACDIRLTVDGDQLAYNAPAGVFTDEVLTLLRQHKAALLVVLKQDHTSISEAMAQEAEAPSTTPALAAPAAVPPSHIEGEETPTAAWHCPCCKGTRRWRSIYGAVVCARCHPPADVALVAGWEDA